jgi:predicted aspartyl protease
MKQKNNHIHALTHSENGIIQRIVTPVEITDVITGKKMSTKGLWDTGATGSVITKSTAAALDLCSFGKRKVRSVHGTKNVNEYFVNITLDNKNITIKARVTECNRLSADNSVGMLIGMNIINKGDFAISNSNGKTTFSFQIPSTHNIDFVQELNEKSE